jgi:hypothetical protein
MYSIFKVETSKNRREADKFKLSSKYLIEIANNTKRHNVF